MSLNPKFASWAGRTVWLVGASTGIGRATAALLHAKGARVIVSARSRAALDAFVAQHPRSDALALLDAVLPQLLKQARAKQGGHLSLVSSVAGYRGLPKSLAYGPTKAALINLAETLHLDLSPLGLGVSVINPGFVETPLTAGNQFHMPALITPEEAARAIVRGWEAGDFEIHFPKRFTLWLKGLRHLGYGAYFAAVRRSTGL
jgi:NAD(P)-dependent dehydrogenase (short-subunit alcohol dehydrogenase family)